jgi:prepilin-type N-terminal cleavage/methylation domain-containing protein
VIPPSSRRLGEFTVPSERPVRGTAGFTLIEVLVAMVILALGLLGLEALGIGAARSIALADRQSTYATIASDSLESALHQLRQGTIPTQFCRTDLPFGDRMSRQIDLSNSQLAQVTIRVIPNPESVNAPSSEFELTSSLYLPVAAVGSVSGTPCS